MLTSFIVNSTDDVIDPNDGVLTLREAIASANSNVPAANGPTGSASEMDEITFDASLSGQTITLDSNLGQLNIEDFVRIDGSGLNDPVTISGDNSVRIFNIADDVVDVELLSLSLTGGNAVGENGGAINIGANVEVELVSLSLSGNVADNGGGIYNSGNGLMIRDSTLSSNTALGSSGSGGGIFVASGDVNIFGTDFFANQANRAGGGIEIVEGDLNLRQVTLGSQGQGNVAGPDGSAAPGNGGGVHVTGDATVQIFSSVVDGNTAASEGGGLWNSSGYMRLRNTQIRNNFGSGGESDNGGGGIFNNGGTLVVDNSFLQSNFANGDFGSGGGIFNDTDGNLVIRGSTIDGNGSHRAGGGIEDNSGFGGGLFIRNARVTNNFTGPFGFANPGNGGGLHITGPGDARIIGGIFSGNSAAAEGGGLWNGSGTMTIDGVTIDGNTAGGPDADQGGGGIFNNGGTLFVQSQTEITNNTANGQLGSGGGIFNGAGGNVLVRDTTIDGNSANRAGGGIEDASLESNAIRLIDATLSTNTAGINGGALHVTGTGGVRLFGGDISSNTAAEEGGGLWNGGGLMTIDDVTIDGNTAHGNDADQGGGGIFNAGGTVSIDGGTITNNTADGTSGSGGGLFNDAGGTLFIDSTTIQSNTANRAGGGIEDNSGSGGGVRLVNVDLMNNLAGGQNANPGNGGGAHISGPGNMDLFGGTISGNSAGREGGGLWNGTGTMRVNDVTINGNTASGDASDDGGGGIFNNGGTLLINRGSNSNNMADGDAGSGGGIFNANDGFVRITGSTISSNSAVRAGGGIENFSGNRVIIIDTTLQNNVAGLPNNAAPGNGGGIHITGTALVDIFNSDILSNSAALEGGGLWNGSGRMVVRESTIDGNTASGDAADDGGGGIFNDGGTLTIHGGSISNNVADGVAGSGGGILNLGGTTLITGTTISGNTANRAGGGIEDTSNDPNAIRLFNVDLQNNNAGGTAPAPGNGGGLHVTGTGGVFIGAGSTVSGNTAALEGGGLWNGGGTMTINRTTIDTNTAHGDAADQGGGGIFNSGGTLNIANVDILDNTADGTAGSGGGIFNDTDGFVFIRDSLVGRNNANRAGGGLEDNSGSGSGFTIVRTTFSMNNAGLTPAVGNPGNGGGVHISGPGDGFVLDSTFTGNVAASEGGGLWNSSGALDLQSTTISNNTAFGTQNAEGGGGIFNNGGIINVFGQGSSLDGNLADGGFGDQILSDDGSVLVTDTSFANTAGVAVTLFEAGGFLDNSTFDGSGVTDVAIYLDDSGNDNVLIGPGFVSNSILFSFDSSVERLAVLAAGGDDTFNVQASADTLFLLFGGDPTPPAVPGDVLNVDTSSGDFIANTPGTEPGSGTFTFTDRADIVYAEMETIVEGFGP